MTSIGRWTGAFSWWLLVATMISAGWLLWPMQKAPPWLEELPMAERQERLDARAGKADREAFVRALGILDPHGVLARLVEQTESGLVIRDEASGEPFEISWSRTFPMAIERERSPPEELDTSREGGALSGLRILLDPGHHGGAWSEVERRHFPVWAVPLLDEDGPGQGVQDITSVAFSGGTGPVDGRVRLEVTRGEDPAAVGPSSWRLGVIREGDLNWATARQLEEMLEAEGAEVYMTRGPPMAEEFPAGMDPTFDPDREARIWLEEARFTDPSIKTWTRLLPSRVAHLALERRLRERVTNDLFELYNRWDLRRRSELAFEVKPDATLSIHYNLARNPELNYVVVFMPGHKAEGELLTSSARHHALARLIEGDIDLTIEIGRRIGRAMHEGMKMPSAPPFVPTAEAKSWPVDKKGRLFARNLAILRRTPGPVLLLEGPFMNNPAEAARLLAEDISIDGRDYPARVEEYAKAVRDAIMSSAHLLFERRERLAGMNLVSSQ